MEQKQNSNHNDVEDFVLRKEKGAHSILVFYGATFFIQSWNMLESSQPPCCWVSHLPPLRSHDRQPKNWELKARPETARALQPADVYTHTSAGADPSAALALEQAIVGDLFQVLDMEQERAGELGKPCTRLDSQLQQSGELAGRNCGGFWLRGVDLNHRPLGYEPNELPDCSTPH
jgi:hypothetical protein